MVVTRLIARMDIKAPNLVKGVHLEGLRKIGDPHARAVKYANEGADEIIYMDIVASLYGRSQILELLERTTDDVFVPITTGGGIRCRADAKSLFDAGADKVALNTSAVGRPELISDLAGFYGSQAVVVSIEAKLQPDGRYECYTENGRERSGLEAVAWAKTACDRGAGEILVTSIDREGTRTGFDIGLVRSIASSVSVPVIASGGFGKPEDFVEAARHVEGIAIADALHYDRLSIQEIKRHAAESGLTMRLQ